MSEKTVARLAKICGMLGSAHEGERASAALMATQILSDLDLSWETLIVAAFSHRPEPEQITYDDKRAPGWHLGYSRWLILNRGDKLGPWEMQFLNSLATRYADARLTEKQTKHFIFIAEKFGLEV